MNCVARVHGGQAAGWFVVVSFNDSIAAWFSRRSTGFEALEKPTAGVFVLPAGKRKAPCPYPKMTHLARPQNAPEFTKGAFAGYGVWGWVWEGRGAAVLCPCRRMTEGERSIVPKNPLLIFALAMRRNAWKACGAGRLASAGVEHVRTARGATSD